MRNKTLPIFYTLGLMVVLASCVQRTAKEVLVIHTPTAVSTLQSDHFNAKYSPNGKLLMMTDQTGNGIKIYDTDKDKISTLTPAIAAGLEMNFSADNKKIYYITHDYSGKKRKSSLVVQDIKTGTTTTIVEGIRHLKLLQTQENAIIFDQNGKLRRYDLTQNTFADNLDGITAVSTNGDLKKITILKNGKLQIIQPFPEGDYLWVTLSPDQKRILFSLVGKGTYSCDLDGKQIIEYGRLHAPKWSWDGQQIIGMDDYDDGQQYTKSDIIISSADGSKKQNITKDSDIIALFPSFSPDNKVVIFNDKNGKVYSINL